MAILDRFKLDGKLAVVTGCRRGIGKALAVALAEAGADIVGVSKSLEPSGSDVEKAVVQAGRKFRSYQCDFRERRAVHEFAARVMADFPVIDILVANAGTARRTPAADHPDEYWDEVIEVNLNSQFVLSRELGKRMVQRGAGKIIFTASLMSFQGGILIPSYAASKGAVAQLTKALANEWAPKGVQVNAIAPGYIATDINAALRASPERNVEILSRIPAGHWGSTDDLQGAVIFLASKASDYVNGTLLTVDGGWMAR
ncbi:MAG: SDR family oxidoreductase [Terriglobia bacterium]